MKPRPSKTRTIDSASPLGMAIVEACNMREKGQTTISLAEFYRYLKERHGFPLSSSALRSYILDVIGYKWPVSRAIGVQVRSAQ